MSAEVKNSALPLVNWNETLAEELAAEENILLTADHWQVIKFLRKFYEDYKILPAMRVLVKELAKVMGAEKGNSIYLQRLFPQGLLRQACKIAGLPKPSKCI